MNKVWITKKKAPKSFLKQLPDLDPLLAQLLFNRCLRQKKEIEDFLSIDYEKDLYNPFLLKGMKEAVTRINQGIKNKEKIAIFGDYDADGICAATILNQTLLKIGSIPLVYIPERKKGYGLNLADIRDIKKNQVKLVITVDCGISDHEEIEFARKQGLDVIITDHHIVPPIPPRAYAIINPKQRHDSYPNKNLAGAGVAFKLASALIKTNQAFFKPGEEKWLLDLTAIATVADMMPLLDENRTLVKYGLLVLAKTRRLGLQALLKEAGIKRISIQWINKNKNRFLVEGLDAYTIGFIIGPRLNAAGRMDHANKAYYLLNADSPSQAQVLAKELSVKNQNRQKIQAKITQAIKKTLIKKEVEEEKVIIRGAPDYPQGIVGLISGKLTDSYYLPSFIYQKERQVSRGSCRGIPEVNVVNILRECKTCLHEFGGHKAAGGFSFPTSKEAEFKKCIRRVIKKKIGAKKLAPRLNIDMILPLENINFKLKKILEELEPFGQGNPEPLFMVKKLIISNVKKVGKSSQHLLLNLTKKENKKDYFLRALLFKNTTEAGNLKKGDCCDFVFTPLFDTWQGEKRLTLKIVDWKKAF